MNETDPIFVKIDRVISQSRLNELAVMLHTPYPDRIGRLAQVLAKLKAGAYLLGTGPSTVGIIPLRSEEVVLGRAATPMEKPSDAVIDYVVADTTYFVPQEVSRVHAKIVRRAVGPDTQYVLRDMASTCGIFVNGRRVDPKGQGDVLSNGDVVSLGPLHVSTFVFYLAPARHARPA